MKEKKVPTTITHDSAMAGTQTTNEDESWMRDVGKKGTNVRQSHFWQSPRSSAKRARMWGSPIFGSRLDFRLKGHECEAWLPFLAVASIVG